MIQKVALLMGILVCISCIAIVSVLYGSIDYSKIPNDYAIIFDAGSSGSRMYIYEWKSGFSAAKGDPVLITQKTSCKASDNGLDKIRSKEELISKYSACIKKAQDDIPNDRKSRAYLFLAATAGMRLLNVRNKTLSDEIFGYVREYFSELEFLFKNQSQARIISGQEEGTNAWISANYFEDNFDTRVSKFDRNNPKTKGILDLGGASTQIVYVPSGSTDTHPGSFFSQIRIFGINYKPYSHSFLCYGVNEISLLYQTYLLNKQDFNLKADGSCFPTESLVKLSSNQILSSPCATGQAFGHKYEFTANQSKVVPNTQYEFNGKSNLSECEKEVNVILPSGDCTYESCSFDNVFQPGLEQANFLAFSNFYYGLSNTAKLFKQDRYYTLEAFKLDTSKLCSMSLSELKELNSNANLPEKFLINQCFSNVYLLTLVSRYGFKNFDNFHATDKVNGYNLNWALGYLINELNRDDFLPFEEPPRKLNLSTYLTITIIMLFVGVVLIAILLFKRLRSTYTLNVEAP